MRHRVELLQQQKPHPLHRVRLVRGHHRAFHPRKYHRLCSPTSSPRSRRLLPAQGQRLVHAGVRPRDHVGAHHLPHLLRRPRPRVHRRPAGRHVPAHDRRHVAAPDLLEAHQVHLRRLHHRVGRFHHRREPPRLDHPQERRFPFSAMLVSLLISARRSPRSRARSGRPAAPPRPCAPRSLPPLPPRCRSARRPRSPAPR